MLERMPSGKPLEFQPPQGFKIPEGVRDGEEFDSLATLRLKKGGLLCLVKLDEQPLPGYGKELKATKDYVEDAGQRYDNMSQR